MNRDNWPKTPFTRADAEYLRKYPGTKQRAHIMVAIAESWIQKDDLLFRLEAFVSLIAVKADWARRPNRTAGTEPLEVEIIFEAERLLKRIKQEKETTDGTEQRTKSGNELCGVCRDATGRREAVGCRCYVDGYNEGYCKAERECARDVAGHSSGYDF